MQAISRCIDASRRLSHLTRMRVASLLLLSGLLAGCVAMQPEEPKKLLSVMQLNTVNGIAVGEPNPR